MFDQEKMFLGGREGSWTPDSGVTSRKFTASLHDRMLFRININRITLLMQYFIERLGNLSTSFTARGCTCTWCGCGMFRITWRFWYRTVPPSASNFHGSLTITNSDVRPLPRWLVEWHVCSLLPQCAWFISHPFLVPNALESRTPLLAYSKTHPRGPYYRSGLLLCGRGGVRTHDLRISCATKTRTLIHHPFYGKRSDHLNYSHN